MLDGSIAPYYVDEHNRELNRYQFALTGQGRKRTREEASRVGTAHNHIEKIADLEVFSCISISSSVELQWPSVLTAFDCGMSSRKFEITSADMGGLRRNTMPACGAYLCRRFADDGSFIALEDPRLTSWLFYSRCRSLKIYGSALEVHGKGSY